MCRTNRPVRAIAADETRLRGKFPGANVRGGFLHNFLCFVQLLRIARGYPGSGCSASSGRPAARVPFEYLFCRKSIKTELQILFGIRECFGLLHWGALSACVSRD